MAVDELVIKWSMDSKNFNDGLTSMDRSMKVLKSEFGATSTKLKQFGNDTEQLKNKQDYLTKSMDIQKSKIDTLKNAYDKQVQATGSNSKEAENLAIKLNNQINYYNKLETELKKTTTELDKQSSTWSKLSKRIEETGAKFKDFGSKMNSFGNKLTLGITVPFVAAGTAMFNSASDMQESINKVEVACKDGSQEVINFSGTTLKQFGIAKGTALDMMATFSDMGNGMGLESQEANKMSMSLVGLAGDLSSFKNIKIDVAKTALNSIYTGETESLKQLGIVMTQANLNEFAMQQGINKTVQEMTQAEQVQLRYAFVMDKTKNAQGDFANTSDGAANQQRIFTESLKELSATFGENLLPVITPFITKLNEMLQKFGSLDKDTQKNIIKFGAFAAATGPVIKTIGGVSEGLGKTMEFASKAGEKFNKLKESTLVTSAATKLMAAAQGALNFVMSLNPITLVIVGLVALGATFAILYNKCEWFREGVNKVWNSITEAFQKFDEFLKNIFSIDWTNSFGALGNVFNAFFANVSNYWEAIKRIFSGIIDFVVGVFTGDWSRAWEGVKNIFGGIMSGLGAVIKAPLNTVIGLINLAIDGLNTINFTAPSWVPFVGGKHFGVNLPKINYLYEGGIINSPTFISPNTVVGDSYKGIGKQAEAVIPLAQMYSNIRNIVREEQTQQPLYVIVNVDNKMDSKSIGQLVKTEVKKEITRDTNNYRRGKGGLSYAL